MLKQTKILKNQNDIIYKVSEETGISKKQVEFIIDKFWESIYHLLTNPFNTKKGILLNTFGRFYLPLRNIKKFSEKEHLSERKKEFYKKLLKQLTDE